MEPNNIKKHYRSCNLCEAICGLVIEHNGKEVISIKGDKEDPFSQGFICPKAVALQDIHADANRLKKPVKKENGKWIEISWKEATDIVTDKLKKIIEEFGNDAIGIYQGNPSVHNLGTMLFSNNFFRKIRSKNRFSATSVDQLPHHFASQEMFGHSLFLAIPDINRTDYLLILGGNPMVSNGSMMTVSGFPRKLKDIQARNGKVVVVDPRKTETAEKADEHIFIKPGTDVYFLAALVNEVLKIDDLRKLPEWTKGSATIRKIFERFTVETVAGITGITKKQIINVAADFTNAKSAICYGRLGVSTQEYGTLCQWLIHLLNIITGNIDRPGGMMFSDPAINPTQYISPKGTQHQYNRWQSRVRKAPEFNSQLPVSVLAEECLTPGKGKILAMVISAGNPVLSTPNGTQLEKAFEGLEFMVAIDIYINETTRYADVILPPATGLEIEHYDLAFNSLAIRNTAKYSSPLFPKERGAKYDWEIFKMLTKKMTKKPYGIRSLIAGIMKPILLLRYGFHKSKYKISLRRLKKEKHGIDLGPLRPCLPLGLFTKDKMVNLAPDLFVSELEKINLLNQSEDDLVLVGRRHVRSNNSWMHNSTRLVKGPIRCTVLINTVDASMRKIENSMLVEVKSETGKIILPAEVTGEIMSGVISIPHGWGHTRSDVTLGEAVNVAGVSVNDITNDKLTDVLSGNAAFSGVPVTVDPVD